MLYSGADDGILKVWDVRRDPTSAAAGTELSTSLPNRHGAGVTSLCFSPHSEHYFATGCYDGIIRIFDKRNLNIGLGSGCPVTSTCSPAHTVDVGGGVWRMKWNKQLDEMAVASMHSGVHVLSCHSFDSGSIMVKKGLQTEKVSTGDHDDEDVLLLPRPTIRLCYNKHHSMAYGVDWCHQGKNIVSCSFYDHSAHFWTVPS
jgi:diphthine methyl ester acylhydrolase